MTGFEITTIILATITTVLTAYTIYRDYFRDVSKKLSNKLMIKRIDYGQSYGSADDQTKGLTIFTIDIFIMQTPILDLFHNPLPHQLIIINPTD
jgi:hypothetical protein